MGGRNPLNSLAGFARIGTARHRPFPFSMYFVGNCQVPYGEGYRFWPWAESGNVDHSTNSKLPKVAQGRNR